jgi:DNA-directed RNA polymerase subunit RPC12/RpoP
MLDAINTKPPKLDKEQQQRLDTAKREASRPPVHEELSRFLNRISEDIEALDRAKRLNLFRQMIKAHQYMDGNFYGYVDANCEWRQREKAPDEVWYSDNQIYPYFRAALMELSRTQTEILVNAPPGSSDELVAAAKFAKSRVDANRDRTYNARLLQTRNAYALLNGIVLMYTYMDYGSGGSERMPKLEKQESEGKTVRMCANCSRMVPDPVDLDSDEKRSPKCPSCGSEMMSEMSMSDGPEVIIGYDDVKTGQNQWTVPNPVSVIFLMTASCIEETPFIKWKQLILRSVLQASFPGISLPKTGITSTELRYINNQETNTPASSGSTLFGAAEPDGSSRELEPVEFERHWLDYPVYCDIKFEEDADLGGGKTLKANQKLGELFPNGLYFSRCGTLILEVKGEDKNRKWSASPYGIRPGTLYGTGSSVALADQEVLNDLESVKMANAFANGVPREFVNPDRISELSADPAIPTVLTPGLNEGNIIGNAYAQAPATTLSPEIYGLSERRESAIQNKIGALSSTGQGGLADAKTWGDTATAISIRRDMAVGRFSPDLELMADELDRKQAIQFIKNEKECFTAEQWKGLSGEYGEYGIEAFLNCDIDRDLIFTVSPGSYMPRSDAQTQAKLVQYAQLLPGLMQAQSPELTAYAGEVFGIPESLAGWTSERAFANKLISRFKSLAELFVAQYGDLPDTALFEDTEQGSQPTPALQVAKQINDYSHMPVDVFLDNHDAMMGALRDWRATDEGRDAPNVLIAAVAFRVLLHEQGKAKQMQMVNRSMLVANEPLQEQQQAQQDAAVQAQQGQQDAQAEQADTQMKAQGLEKLAHYADKDEQRQHEADLQKQQQDHDAAMKAADIAAKVATSAPAQ